ncbi:MAG: hypothetical protein FIA91_06215 [Geobacter sp.]|nr:hypothetical protein [Geobacter sp.]
MTTPFFFVFRSQADATFGKPVYGEEKWAHRYGRAELGPKCFYETIKCPEYVAHMRSGKRLTDLQVILSSDNIGDLVWSWSNDCIITERVRQLLQAQDFRGYITRPVEVIKIKKKAKTIMTELPSLWELVVTGSGGVIHEASGVRLKYTCDKCGLRRYSNPTQDGILVDNNQWDGTDFFRVEPYGYILVSERVKEFISHNNLVNCALFDSTKFTFAKSFL